MYVQIYVKNDLQQGVKVVKNNFDTINWLHLDKSILNIDRDIYLCSVYMWTDDCPAAKLYNVDLFDLLQCDIYIF